MAKYSRKPRARYQAPEVKQDGIGGTLFKIIATVLMMMTGSMIGIRLMTSPSIIPALPVSPTAIIAIPRPQAAPVVQPAAPIPGIAQNAATAQAQFDAAVRAGEQGAPVPNIDVTGDPAPVQLLQRPAEERQPAGENVPTAEPIPPTPEGGSLFGSKPAKLVDIQETHECKHGQIWIEGKGCKNP